MGSEISRVWWILHKDLISEYRSRRSWPTMLLLGLVVAFVLSMQMDLLTQQKQQLVGGMLWLVVFLAGMTAVDRSLAAEQEDGCWEALQLYPLSPGVLYLAKTTANFLALSALEALLIPLFFLLSAVPLAPCLAPLALIALLANLGLAACGTLVGALAISGRSGNLLVLIGLAISIPDVLAASECTRLAIAGTIDQQWWRWIQLMAAFAVLFVTCGAVLFPYAIED